MPRKKNHVFHHKKRNFKKKYRSKYNISSKKYLITRYVAYSNSTLGNSVGGSLTFSSNQFLNFSLSNVAGSLSYGSMALNFQLRDLPNYSELTSLWDRYKINFVKVKIIPYNTGSLTGAAFSSVYGQSSCLIHSALDYDDTALPSADSSGVDGLRQYQTYKVSNILMKPHVRVVRPSLLTALNDVTGTSIGGKVTKGYVNLSNTLVPHFGMKFMFEGMSGGSSDALNGFIISFKVEAKFYVSLKDVR